MKSSYYLDKPVKVFELGSRNGGVTRHKGATPAAKANITPRGQLRSKSKVLAEGTIFKKSGPARKAERTKAYRKLAVKLAAA